MQNTQTRDLGFFQPVESLGGRIMSLRGYVGTITGLTLIGFLAILVCYGFTSTPMFLQWVYVNPGAFSTATLVASVASIAGIIIQLIGNFRVRRSGTGLWMMVAGYVLLVGSLGFTTSFLLTMYTVNSIFAALIGTACISVVMTIAGFAFPQFFQRIGGILLALLIGVILAQIIFFFLGISQGWLDWVVLVIFAGFIAFDTYRAMHSEPTLPNAIFWATSLYLDLLNIFIRLLAIFGDRR